MPNGLFGATVNTYTPSSTTTATSTALSLVVAIPLAVLALLSFIGWISMLVHAIKNDIPNKAVWIVVMIVFNIGWIIYYFVVKRPYDQAHKTVGAMTSQPPTDPTNSVPMTTTTEPMPTPPTESESPVESAPSTETMPPVDSTPPSDSTPVEPPTV